MGLLGLFARSETNWFEGWGPTLGVLVTGTSGGDRSVQSPESTFVWGKKRTDRSVGTASET